MLGFLKRSTSGETSGASKPWIILLGGALGIVLLLFGGKISTQKSTDSPRSDTPTRQEEIAQYQSYLETRVEELCSEVNGVGHVKAIVTLSGGFESVYATELQGDGEDYVILGSGSAASGLLLQERTPQIVGIGVVCDGADNVDVRGELIALISASFHIPTNRIYIAQAKK